MTTTERAAPTITTIRSTAGAVLYESSAPTLREAVEEAARSGAYLGGAYLRGAYLSGADLRGADLRGADLRGAYLRGVYLSGADLGGVYLSGAYLSGADLGGADLSGAYLRGLGLTFDAGPSGRGWLIRLDDEGRYQPDAPWRITIGCWREHSLDDLRDLIADRAEWPEATGDERDRRRPYLAAVLALCEAHIAYEAGR